MESLKNLLGTEVSSYFCDDFTDYQFSNLFIHVTLEFITNQSFLKIFIMLQCVICLSFKFTIPFILAVLSLKDIWQFDAENKNAEISYNRRLSETETKCAICVFFSQRDVSFIFIYLTHLSIG